MDLDLFLEQDIPVFLDGFELNKENASASESEINSLLTEAEVASSEKSKNKILASNSDAPNGVQQVELHADTINLSLAKQDTTLHSSVKASDDSSILDASDGVVDELARSQTYEPVSEQEEYALYTEAVTAIKKGNKQEAVNLLRRLLASSSSQVAYRTRLYDALRLPGELSEEVPLPESTPDVSLATPSTSSLEETIASEETSISDDIAKEVPVVKTVKEPIKSVSSPVHHSTSTTHSSVSDSDLDSYVDAVRKLKSGIISDAKSILQKLLKQKPNNLAIHLRLDEIKSLEGKTHD